MATLDGFHCVCRVNFAHNVDISGIRSLGNCQPYLLQSLCLLIDLFIDLPQLFVGLSQLIYLGF